MKTGLSENVRKIEREQYQSVIRCLLLERKLRNEIKEHLDAVCGSSNPSLATVKNWFINRNSTEDNVTKDYDLVLRDCQGTVDAVDFIW